MTGELTVVRRTVKLAGGRVLSVARYRDESGSTVFVLRKGWPEGDVLPDPDARALTLSADEVPGPVEALEELAGDVEA